MWSCRWKLSPTSRSTRCAAWRTCATVWPPALKSNLQVAVDIKFVEPKTIARSEGKAKRVIDLRGENQ